MFNTKIHFVNTNMWQEKDDGDRIILMGHHYRVNCIGDGYLCLRLL